MRTDDARSLVLAAVGQVASTSTSKAMAVSRASAAPASVNSVPKDQPSEQRWSNEQDKAGSTDLDGCGKNDPLHSVLTVQHGRTLEVDLSWSTSSRRAWFMPPHPTVLTRLA